MKKGLFRNSLNFMSVLLTSTLSFAQTGSGTTGSGTGSAGTGSGTAGATSGTGAAAAGLDNYSGSGSGTSGGTASGNNSAGNSGAAIRSGTGSATASDSINGTSGGSGRGVSGANSASGSATATQGNTDPSGRATYNSGNGRLGTTTSGSDSRSGTNTTAGRSAAEGSLNGGEGSTSGTNAASTPNRSRVMPRGAIEDSTSQSRSAVQRNKRARSDLELERQVELKISKAPNLSDAAKKVDVSARNGSIILSGSVPTQAEKMQIENQAAQVVTGAQVQNDIQVSTQSSGLNAR